MVTPGLDVIIADYASFQGLPHLGNNSDSRKVLLIPDQHFPTGYPDLQKMISCGLVGIIQANTDSRLLKKAIAKVHSGELWFDQQIIRNNLCNKIGKKSLIHLTSKETLILNHICTGLTNREIASELYISEQTVKTYCYHLFKKFGVTNRVKLALHVMANPNSYLI